MINIANKNFETKISEKVKEKMSEDEAINLMVNSEDLVSFLKDNKKDYEEFIIMEENYVIEGCVIENSIICLVNVVSHCF